MLNNFKVDRQKVKGPIKLLDAVTTGTGASENLFGTAGKIVAYCTWSGTVTAGSVVLEVAPRDVATEAWSTLTTFNFAADQIQHFEINAPHRCIRARVVTNVVAGNVTVQVSGL